MVGAGAEALIEALKLLHTGPLGGPHIASVSCSGGEASLMADLADGTAVRLPAFAPATLARLSAVLGPRVALANPLDYHTFIWGDVAATTEVFTAVLADLAATADWATIYREWLPDGPGIPTTPLGEADATWFRGREAAT